MPDCRTLLLQRVVTLMKAVESHRKRQQAYRNAFKHTDVRTYNSEAGHACNCDFYWLLMKYQWEKERKGFVATNHRSR
jgi:hypothetical protein